MRSQSEGIGSAEIAASMRGKARIVVMLLPCFVRQDNERLSGPAEALRSIGEHHRYSSRPL